jgi:hypothetical protein
MEGVSFLLETIQYFLILNTIGPTDLYPSTAPYFKTIVLLRHLKRKYLRHVKTAGACPMLFPCRAKIIQALSPVMSHVTASHKLYNV